MKRRHEPIRIAGVGAGYFAQHHYEAWSRLPDASLVGIADTDEGKARGYALKYTHADVWIGSAAADMMRSSLAAVCSPGSLMYRS